MNDTATFQFKPRQEAHPMKWDELMTPVRRALADLLIRIECAECAVNETENKSDKKEVANCFLVHGIRGTGKTTVLLSAHDAICPEPKENIFLSRENEKANEETLEEKNLRESVSKSIQYLKEQHIVWLPILDLEPLPIKFNLLTTLLTHVLNAIEQSDNGRKAQPTSIFEESADSPRQKFKELIRDATTIWEEIQEIDTRGKVSRQVAAADMYAKFRKQFQDAMTALSEQLGKKYGRDAKGCSVVLSIDNIDRNTDHLYDIVKFAQLISHNRLWLIMAGEEKDIENFLERGYWKELNYKKDIGIIPCRVNWEGEDETLVLARRQSAAAYQKLLPPSHRIEIDRVKPNETLKFKPSAEDKSIHQLFEGIKIFLHENEKSKEINFNVLLGVKKLVHSLEPESQFKNLTHFAWHALHLPARTVLDLWQLAHYVVKDKINDQGEQFQAERIARKMLRNAIFRSPISNTLGKCVQEDIIRRPPDGGTLLNFDRYEIRVRYLLKQVLEKTPKLQHQPELGSTSRSTICCYKGEDIIIYLEQKNAISIKKNADKFKNSELPDIVAAWLSILYDILMMVERPAIISPINLETHFIMASHELTTFNVWNKNEPKEFWWPAPLWSTFYAHDAFFKDWNKVYSDLLKFNFLDLYPTDSQEVVDLNTRLIVARWIECVLKGFVKLNWQSIEHVEVKTETQKILDKFSSEKYEKVINEARAAFEAINSIPTFSRQIIEIHKENAAIEEMQDIAKNIILCDLEKKVIDAAHQLYDAINYKDIKRVLIENEQMKEWLEKKLPLLFSYLYVPLDEPVASSRCNNMISISSKYGKSNLTLYWEKNASFFLVDLDKEMEKIFPRDKILKELYPDKKVSSDMGYKAYIESLGPFGSLHKYWNKNLYSKKTKGNPHA